MPDAPRPDDARPDETDGVPGDVARPDVPGDVPSEAELERIATPATVRRAPRYRAFMVTGALVGVVVALVVAFATAGSSGVASDDGGVLPFLGGQNGVRWLLALTGAVVGSFAGGGVAAFVDRRSARRAQRSVQP
ncbi:histidine kinase [Cellulomonas iranensis]|uniref:histidine kinase n=1 Tax=Cellulomonas iranensis TaxID=76862 RepID=UPI001CF36629|nr:histidine kinase [Cellulomonas iranensis]UCN15428.1 histidine kinase [Cellulomonas iranensis]